VCTEWSHLAQTHTALARWQISAKNIVVQCTLTTTTTTTMTTTTTTITNS